MKAVAVMFPSREVRVLEVPEPRLHSPTEVKVRTLEVGVCGTDQDLLKGHHGAAPRGEDHLVPGHECLGQVMEVGAHVQGLRPGDLVVPRVRRPCPHTRCPACRHGHPDFCVTGDYTERGIQGAHGFCSEHFVEDAAYLHRVDDTLRDVAVLTEPLTIAEKGLREVAHIQSRLPWKVTPGRALVLGAGPVAQLGAMALMRAGHDVTVYSRSPKPNEKAAAAEAVGAPYVSSKEVTVDALKQRLGGVDLIYEATGASKVAFDSLQVLEENGVLIFTGVPGREEPLELHGEQVLGRLVLGNRVMFGTVNAADSDFHEALEDLARFRARWPGKVEALITQRHPPAEFAKAVEAKDGIKHVISFQEHAR
ncbi:MULTISPECIES: glucose 1-dehydrogenase [Corallococcus]|uniref:glucose 1-dehydrogenase n=1 Tax=Corallococcus TaxID=83461 RepID=UPI00117E285F|nr:MULTISPECIES: glucose 1-dehydrogenase [Corallococcus]NBD12880.1 alcohol dehydrogenase catalytic domain-containing protein [Corallococcus silvisoli]TSC21535.1 zinc-binding dehydrogenase [Corallococcus sp. Z5C101001]